MGYSYVKSVRQRNKDRIISVMGGQCCICGYNKCKTALELHHLDAKAKEFTICENLNQAWETIVTELPKTVLVCCNCHREIHAGLIVAPVKSTFNPVIADSITQEIKQLKHKALCYCKNCGALVTSGNVYCVECAATMRRIVERPGRDILKSLVRTMPFIQIAKLYGVSDNAVRKWCKHYNLPHKSTIIKNLSDTVWETI